MEIEDRLPVPEGGSGRAQAIAIAAGCLFLVAYLGYLLFMNYRSEVALRQSAFRGFQVDLEKKAVSVGYFFSERKHDMRRLAGSREVQAYFANRATGMSEEYGLKVNIFVLDRFFRQTMTGKKFQENEIYNRIALLDQDGQTILDTSDDSAGSDLPPLPTVLAMEGIEPQVLVFELNGQPAVLCVAPCQYRDKTAGWLLSWVNVDTIADSFVHTTADLPGKEVHLVSHTGLLICSSSATDRAGPLTIASEAEGGTGKDGFRAYKFTEPGGAVASVRGLQLPVDGTAMTLLGRVSLDAAEGTLTPLQLFAGMAALAAMILLGLVMLFRSTAQNLILRGRFQESARQQAVLEETNRQLRGEIARRREAEKERERYLLKLHDTQKLEAIGTLAGGIAHDFNNILSAIVGYSELAKIHCPEGSQIRSYVDKVLVASERARGLVKQILTFGRKTKHEAAFIGPDHLAHEVLELLDGSIPKTIEIRKNIQDECGSVLMDPNQFHQIVLNLCTNAYQAMRDQGGVIEIGLKTVDVNACLAGTVPDLHEGPYIRLTVEDTGTGIPEEVLPRVLEPFFTTKPVGEGSGMGLAVVHGIVRSVGGAISLESRVGEGTRVSVYLPRQNEQPLEAADERPTSAAGNEKILFVDDEEMLARLGEESLGSLGYDVASFTTGAEALKRFRTTPDAFDMVITDQTMPGLTGAQLAQEILKIRPNIPVIICTGYSEVLDEERAQRMGIQGFLFKPLEREQLAQKIRELLDRNAGAESSSAPPGQGGASKDTAFLPPQASA